MRIAVLRAGNYGCTTAADLTIKGHEVTLVKTTRTAHNANFDFIKETGELLLTSHKGGGQIAKLAKVTTDLAEVAAAEVIFICIQTSYHEPLIEKLAPFLNSDQILVINPGYCSTAYVLKHCDTLPFAVVEATSSFIDSRIIEPGVVNDSFRNYRNPVGVFPVGRVDEALERLAPLGYPLFPFPCVLEAAIHNPNIIVHTLPGIMSIPRIEATKGDYSMYHEVFTPTVWRMVEALDAEKMNILAALDYPRVPYVEACKFRNTLDDERDGKEIFFWYAGRPEVPAGPHEVDSRYIAEDVPQGLVLLESLGKMLGVRTPVTTALIELASAALGRDLRAEGRTPERLGRANLERIREDCKTTASKSPLSTE